MSTKLNFPSVQNLKNIWLKTLRKFILQKNGTVQQATISKSVCKECDLEALRVVKKLRLNPILINGKPERVRFRIPIRLALE
ncbi:energy transducer TonB [Paenimyroides aestuarii]|uniref:Energy transducer TonB n=1 Tax=Paenimyroides aestuarii TaxID=2968490 RepID=A0ABY5NU11_9FLAO|nr:energy transducer TonB [Paenimyroides aestuarii]UUV22020.1 energy transducer TonB [Paenimyroides aestuarii]